MIILLYFQKSLKMLYENNHRALYRKREHISDIVAWTIFPEPAALIEPTGENNLFLRNKRSLFPSENIERAAIDIVPEWDRYIATPKPNQRPIIRGQI